jgi:hypothetical protein
VIDDALGFFKKYRFPNGRYRIYVQDAKQPARLIIEIAIRDGQAVSPENQPIPAKREAPAAAPMPPRQPEGGAPDVSAEAPPATIESNPSTEPRRDGKSSESQPAGADRVLSVPPHRWSLAGASAAASLGLTATKPSWGARIGHRLSRRDELPRTRFHRRRRHLH